jgi:hypothetical protein
MGKSKWSSHQHDAEKSPDVVPGVTPGAFTHLDALGLHPGMTAAKFSAAC